MSEFTVTDEHVGKINDTQYVIDQLNVARIALDEACSEVKNVTPLYEWLSQVHDDLHNVLLSIERIYEKEMNDDE